MRRTIVAITALFSSVIAIPQASADGLAPCDKDADPLIGELAKHVHDSPTGDVVVSFVALPPCRSRGRADREMAAYLDKVDGRSI